MKQLNSNSPHWAKKMVITLSLLLFFAAPLLAKGNGGPHHPPPPPPPHHNDSIPPPPGGGNDSIGDTTHFPPPPPPPHHGRGNDSIGDTTHFPPPPPPRGRWNDSTGDTNHFPPPPPPPFGRGNDSLHRWNDTIPNWDSIPHQCGGNRDSIGVDKMKIGNGTVNIYPNPILSTAKVHISNATGTLTFNVFDGTGRLVIVVTNVTNGDIQISKSGLLPGIYVYQLRNNSSLISSGQVVIQ